MSEQQAFLCLVINLDGSDARWISVSEQLRASDLRFERLAASDGRLTPVDAVADYDAAATRRYMGRTLVGGEIGCYHSHLAAARRFLDSAERHCLVIEDDARVASDLGAVVSGAIAYLDAEDPGWRIVNLGSDALKISTPCHRLDTERGGHDLCRAFYFPMTTGAILWSRRGAQDFVSGHRRIFAPVDNYLRHWITRAGGGYAFSPRPVATIAIQSDIAGAADGGRSHTGRDLLYGYRKQRRLLSDKLIALLRQRQAKWRR